VWLREPDLNRRPSGYENRFGIILHSKTTHFRAKYVCILRDMYPFYPYFHYISLV
jgi:hypothetical protein